MLMRECFPNHALLMLACRFYLVLETSDSTEPALHSITKMEAARSLGFSMETHDPVGSALAQQNCHAGPMRLTAAEDSFLKLTGRDSSIY